VLRPSVTANVEIDEDGIPADRSDQWLDLAEPNAPTDEPSPEAGAEVRELAPVS
jgi:hypothetical protein